MKTMKLFSMAALALAMAACSNNDDNEIQQNTQQPGTMHFTATIAAPSGDATTRTVYNEVGTTINVTWEVGDKIALVHNSVKDVATVTAVDGSGKATIEADFTVSPSDDDDVTLAYPADAVYSATPYKTFTFTPNPVIFDKVKNDQDGTLAYIQNNLDLRVGSGKLAVSGSDVTLKGSVSIPSLICIWKLTLQDESSNPLSATKLTFKNNDDTQAGTTSTGGKSVYYLCVVPSFIPDPSGTFSFEATVGGVTYIFSKTGLSLTAGKYYQSTVTMAEVKGEYFTSKSDGTKVVFSPGNLQYRASTNTWRFAVHQYNVVGSANSNISSSYSGWIDLFGWGTSNKTFASGYGSSTQPWSTITTGPSYGPTGTSNGLYGTFANGDWGVNMTGYTWRTLTGGDGGEWIYIFNSRASGATVNGNSNARYAKATINTDGTAVNGIILFPDGCKINSSSATTWGAINNASNNYTTKCTTAQWSHLEELGCVFLPATGYRDGTAVTELGSYGYYWSSSPYASHASKAHIVYFHSGGVVPADNNWRDRGYSVRLVREVTE